MDASVAGGGGIDIYPLFIPTDPFSGWATAGTITIEALEAHVAYLADDAREGRMAGEPGYEAAAQYVANRFAEFGLAPGGEDGWYQQVPLISYRIDEESTTLIAQRDSKDSEFEYKEAFDWFEQVGLMAHIDESIKALREGREKRITKRRRSSRSDSPMWGLWVSCFWS